MRANIVKTSSGIEDNLNGMLTRSKAMSSYLNRVLFRKYQKAQLERWQTEGASEDLQWQPLNKDYERWKKKKFAAYPGSGNAMMIATDRLRSGATGEDSAYYYKMVTDDKFVVGINLGALPYAPYPGVLRSYMKFKEETLDGWRRGLSAYIQKNVEVFE